MHRYCSVPYLGLDCSGPRHVLSHNLLTRCTNDKYSLFARTKRLCRGCDVGIARGQGYTRIMDLIALAVPFFLLSIAIEWSWGRWCGRDTYRLTDAVSSLTLGGLSQARRFVALGVGGTVYAWLASVTPFTTWTTEGWQAWLIAFVLYDLCYYLSLIHI